MRHFVLLMVRLKSTLLKIEREVEVKVPSACADIPSRAPILCVMLGAHAKLRVI